MTTSFYKGLLVVITRNSRSSKHHQLRLLGTTTTWYTTLLPFSLSLPSSFLLTCTVHRRRQQQCQLSSSIDSLETNDYHHYQRRRRLRHDSINEMTKTQPLGMRHYTTTTIIRSTANSTTKNNGNTRPSDQNMIPTKDHQHRHRRIGRFASGATVATTTTTKSVPTNVKKHIQYSNYETSKSNYKNNKRKTTSPMKTNNARNETNIITNITNQKIKKGRWKNVIGSRYDKRQQLYQQQSKDNDEPTHIQRHPSSSSIIWNNDTKKRQSTTRTTTNNETTINSISSSVSSKVTPRRQQPKQTFKYNNTAATTIIKTSPPTANTKSNNNNNNMSIYITCHKGLESCLFQELQTLHISYIPKGYGAIIPISVSSKKNDKHDTITSIIHILQLYIGSASHIYIQYPNMSFTARALGELQRKVSLVSSSSIWNDILPLDNKHDHTISTTSFQIKVVSYKSRLLHTTAIRDHVLQGIYTSLGTKNPSKQQQQQQTTTTSSTSMQQHDMNHLKGTDHDEKHHNKNVIHLLVQIYQDNVEMYINTSSSNNSSTNNDGHDNDSTIPTPLYQRQYKYEVCKAPLREDIAYALLYMSGYRPIYYLLPKVPQQDDDAIIDQHLGDDNLFKKQEITPKKLISSLLDPFCGSGTIPIEAAAMIAGLPPGRLRSPPLFGTRYYQPEKWYELVNHAIQFSKQYNDSYIQQHPTSYIYASDRDQGATQATKSNAERAGVLQYMTIDCCAFTKHPWIASLQSNIRVPDDVYLVSNLPFGRRVSTVKETVQNHMKHPLLPLYQSLANHINSIILKSSDHDENHHHHRQQRPCNLNVMLLTDNRDLVRLSGYKTNFVTKLSTNHGGIPVCGMYMKHTNHNNEMKSHIDATPSGPIEEYNIIDEKHLHQDTQNTGDIDERNEAAYS